MRTLNRRLLAEQVSHPAIRIVVTTMLLAGIQSLFAVLSSRWLGPEQRGVFTIAAVLATFSLLIGSLGVFTGGRVLLARLNAGISWQEYWFVIVAITGLQVGIAAIVNVPAWWILAGGTARHLGPTLSFFAYCLFITAASLAREGLHGVGRHVRAVLSDILAAGIKLSTALILVILGQVTVTALLLAGSFGFAVQLMMCWRTTPLESVVKSVRLPSFRMVKRVVEFSLPSVFLSIGQMFIQKGDRLILGSFTSPGEVGIYAAGATLADAAWILPVSVSVVVLRQVATKGDLQPLKKWRRAILLTTTLAALILAVASAPLIHILLGAEYNQSIHIVWILCGGSILFASQQVDIAACNGLGRLDVGAKTSILGAGVLLLSSILLIPRFGGTGAAYASILAYASMAVFVRFTTRLIEHRAPLIG